MSSETHAPLARVAVLLSGAYRTLTDCNDTIARHVISANPWARFDVYAALTADHADEAERKRMEAAVRFSGACIAAVRIESNGAVSAAVKRDTPSIDALPKGVAHLATRATSAASTASDSDGAAMGFFVAQRASRLLPSKRS